MAKKKAEQAETVVTSTDGLGNVARRLGFEHTTGMWQAAEPTHSIDLSALAMRIARAWTIARATSIIDRQFNGKAESCAIYAPTNEEINAIRAELLLVLGPSKADSSIALAK